MSKHSDKTHIKVSDEKIIEMYWRREERAIKETDIKYGQFLFGIAYNILNDRLDSEECQSSTYLEVWNAIPPTRPVVFPAFIAQIMRRVAINRYKEKTRKKRIPSELTVSLEECESILASNDSVNGEYEAERIGMLINEYLNGLTKRQRYIFVGRFYIAESVESIADDLAVTTSTVYRELVKIKMGLKHHLEKNEVHI